MGLLSRLLQRSAVRAERRGMLARAAPAAPAAGPSNTGSAQRTDADMVRYWVERYGGGEAGEANAVRDFRDDLAEAQSWPENVRARRMRDVEEQIRLVESGEYRAASPNMFSRAVEEAFPKLYASRASPDGGAW